jgi:hypothetical protein
MRKVLRLQLVQRLTLLETLPYVQEAAAQETHT